MDRNGKADPFVSVSIPGLASLGASRGQSQQNSDAFKRQTAVMPKTLSPEWKSEVWDFEITEEWFGSLGWQSDLDTEEVDVLVDEPGDMADGDETMEGEQDEVDNASAQVAALQIQQEPKVNETMSARSIGSGAEVAGAAGDGASTPILSRPPSRRVLSSTASKVLATSAKGIKLLPKGAAAGARAVARGTPRPIRIRRRGSRNLSPAHQLTGQATARGLVSNLEIVVWDKDFARREYMGEASWPVWAWCRGRNVEWPTATEDVNDGVWLSLVSSRRSTSVSGKVQVRLGLVPVPGSPVKSLERLYRRLVTSAVGTTAKAGDQQTVLTTDTTVNEDDIRAGVRAIPASQSVGTGERFFADNGFSSDEDEEQEEVVDSDDSDSDDDDDEDDVDDEGTESDLDASGTGTEAESSTNEAEADADFLSKHKDRLRQGQRASSGDADASQLPSGASTPGASTAGSNSPQHSHNMHSARSRRKIWRGLGRKSATLDKSSSADSDLLLSNSGSTKGKRLSGRGKKNQDGSAIPNVGNAKKIRRMQRRMERRERKREARAASQDYSFKSSSDIIGIVMMEIKKATDLPRWRNSMRTGFDMDPFTIVAFGQKVFRTRVLRHTLNPVWEEKLLFHVHQHEDNYRIKMSIYDWDKLTANDNVGSCELSMAALMDGAPKADPKTGLYPQTEQEQTKLQTFDLNLTRVGKDEDVKYGESSPVLQVRANFTPYAALRQRFWRQLCQQFDTNDSGSLSVLEITSMLDSLGSTLSQETIASFFTRFGKAAHADDLTLDEAIIALEAETQKPPKEKKSVTPAPALGETLRDVKDTSANVDKSGESVMDVSGPGAHAPAIHVQGSDEEGPKPIPHSVIAGRDATDEPVSKSLTEDQVDLRRVSSDTEQQPPSPLAYSGGESPPSDVPQQDSRPVERLILLKSCPLCHMPRLSKKADGDVVTHLAVCASQDWRRVDSLVVSNFVTASQAHRKWFNKVVITATQGKYKLGVNSANIIVQDRETGELLEEKMQVYVRLGIRLLYQGARSRMEGARVRKMLKNMSVKQGRKYDSPASAREIAGFIAFHNLNVDEIRDPLDSYKTFNQFFYRKLKPTARPITEPKNPNRLVSSADCRLMVFPSIDAATTIWVKGREFSVDRLLGDDYRDRKADYAQGTLCIFRLAPQDYHRFHCPADAVVKSIRHIEGALYTVNPMSIRSAIDVYGENSRTIVEFESNEFGTFYAVNVGAMLVGSIIITVQEGQNVKRGDEMGYYAFGGSTTILVFAKGYVEWDDDIEANSNAAIETLVKQGTGIGWRSGAAVG